LVEIVAQGEARGAGLRNSRQGQASLQLLVLAVLFVIEEVEIALVFFERQQHRNGAAQGINHVAPALFA